MRKYFVAMAAFGLLTAAPALAGPPLICHATPIGSAQSLPWLDSASGWNGMDPSYNVSRLVSDTLHLLNERTPLPVRMETLRRAAIYSSRQTGLAESLENRLAERTGALALFDAGYFAETVREAVEAYTMLHDPSAQAAWKLRSYPLQADGVVLIEKAIQTGSAQVKAAGTQTLMVLRQRR